ncbi:hypothetical protein FN846DRAFT_985461 [Sphaerosporella brunnea]|uniref:Uncharacterized protein n=1 Tax=Sphaerosporella brunnea TaxID=1250544 RepID=A0A5J5EVA7_9PEZI|nr:hypothetical protein FN846DRAFT_985461 [Sphaerosporella brunnea]
MATAVHRLHVSSVLQCLSTERTTPTSLELKIEGGKTAEKAAKHARWMNAKGTETVLAHSVAAPQLTIDPPRQSFTTDYRSFDHNSSETTANKVLEAGVTALPTVKDRVDGAQHQSVFSGPGPAPQLYSLQSCRALHHSSISFNRAGPCTTAPFPSIVPGPGTAPTVPTADPGPVFPWLHGYDLCLHPGEGVGTAPTVPIADPAPFSRYDLCLHPGEGVGTAPTVPIADPGPFSRYDLCLHPGEGVGTAPTVPIADPAPFSRYDLCLHPGEGVGTAPTVPIADPGPVFPWLHGYDLCLHPGKGPGTAPTVPTADPGPANELGPRAQRLDSNTASRLQIPGFDNLWGIRTGLPVRSQLPGFQATTEVTALARLQDSISQELGPYKLTVMRQSHQLLMDGRKKRLQPSDLKPNIAVGCAPTGVERLRATVSHEVTGSDIHPLVLQAATSNCQNFRGPATISKGHFGEQRGDSSTIPTAIELSRMASREFNFESEKMKFLSMLVILAGSATAHSWLECVDTIVPNKANHSAADPDHQSSNGFQGSLERRQGKRLLRSNSRSVRVSSAVPEKLSMALKNTSSKSVPFGARGPSAAPVLPRERLDTAKLAELLTEIVSLIAVTNCLHYNSPPTPLNFLESEKMKPLSTPAIFAGSAAAHSWLECVDTVFPDKAYDEATVTQTCIPFGLEHSKPVSGGCRHGSMTTPGTYMTGTDIFCPAGRHADSLDPLACKYAEVAKKRPNPSKPRFSNLPASQSTNSLTSREDSAFPKGFQTFFGAKTMPSHRQRHSPHQLMAASGFTMHPNYQQQCATSGKSELELCAARGHRPSDSPRELKSKMKFCGSERTGGRRRPRCSGSGTIRKERHCLYK